MGTLVIAEAGVNHNGSLEVAEKMIDVAADAGVDFIKFQTFSAKHLVTQQAAKAEYQKEKTGVVESQLDMLRKLELSKEAHWRLQKHCEAKKIKFLSTPFDLLSISFLASMNIDYWKIPSGEITNYPYLVAIAKTGKDIIMSTGMSTLAEIHAAIELLKKHGCGRISLLHCNTEYPTPYHDVNLHAMQTLRDEFGLEVGYSDHTQGIEVPIAAVAMGATMIEKHFTLDKDMLGPDHKASLSPEELKAMVLCIRHIEQAKGSPEKKVSASEEKNKDIARKSIVASCDILQGEIFSESNITAKRPGNGMSPMRWPEVLGQCAKRNFSEDELIEL